MTYAKAVEKVARCLIKRANIERYGTFGHGWFDASSDLMHAVREAQEAFPEKGSRIMLDAYRLIGMRIE